MSVRRAGRAATVGVAVLAIAVVFLSSPAVAAADRAAAEPGRSADLVGPEPGPLPPSPFVADGERARIQSTDTGNASPATDRGTKVDSVERGVVANVTLNRTTAPGVVRVRLEYRLAPEVSKLVVYGPENATVVDRHGLTPVTDRRRHRWNGTAARPSITYSVAVNRTFLGGYSQVDTGDWALVRYSLVGTAFQSNVDGAWHTSWSGGDDWYRSNVHILGPGVVGGNFAYLGEANVTNRTVPGDGPRVRLAISDDVATSPNRSQTLSYLSWLARERSFGSDDRVVTLFVLPAPVYASYAAGWGPHGDIVMQGWQGPRALAHEFVHVEQSFDLAPKMAWFAEGSASYYGDLLALQAGRISYGEFRQSITSDAYARADLAANSRHADPAHYTKGARVLAALDLYIRRSSGGDRSLDAVVRRMNHHQGRVTYQDFQRFVAVAAGHPMNDWLYRHVATSAVPTVPNPTRLARVDSGATGSLPTYAAARPPSTLLRRRPGVTTDASRAASAVVTRDVLAGAWLRPGDESATPVALSAGSGPGFLAVWVTVGDLVVLLSLLAAVRVGLQWHTRRR
ncbi:MAG: hypothetical protein ABEJ08_01275 [Halobacteriaceae archaeon]